MKRPGKSVYNIAIVSSIISNHIAWLHKIHWVMLQHQLDFFYTLSLISAVIGLYMRQKIQMTSFAEVTKSDGLAAKPVALPSRGQATARSFAPDRYDYTLRHSTLPDFVVISKMRRFFAACSTAFAWLHTASQLSLTLTGFYIQNSEQSHIRSQHTVNTTFHVAALAPKETLNLTKSKRDLNSCNVYIFSRL